MASASVGSSEWSFLGREEQADAEEPEGEDQAFDRVLQQGLSAKPSPSQQDAWLRKGQRAIQKSREEPLRRKGASFAVLHSGRRVFDLWRTCAGISALERRPLGKTFASWKSRTSFDESALRAAVSSLEDQNEALKRQFEVLVEEQRRGRWRQHLAGGASVAALFAAAVGGLLGSQARGQTKQQFEDLRFRLEEAQVRLKALDQGLRQSGGALGKAEERVTAVELKYRQVKEELESQQRDLQTCGDNVGKAEKRVTALERKLGQVDKELESQQRDLQACGYNVGKAEKRVTALELKLGQVDKELESKQRDLQKCGDNFEKLSGLPLGTPGSWFAREERRSRLPALSKL